MTDIPSDIRDLFARFERASADLDAAALEEVFAEHFLSCDPSGATPVSRDVLLRALPMRQQLFASAGLGPARLVRLDADELDERHVLTRTAWAVPDRSGQDAVQLETTFLVRRTDSGPRVVLYLNHVDIAQVVASRRGPER